MVVEHGNNVVPEEHIDGEQASSPLFHRNLTRNLLKFRIAREGSGDDMSYQPRAEPAGFSDFTSQLTRRQLAAETKIRALTLDAGVSPALPGMP